MTDTPVNLATLLELTDRVQAAISEGDWMRATELEGERRSLLETFLTDEIDQHGGLEHLGEPLRAFQVRHNELIGEVHHHRRRLLRDASTVQTGRKAAAAYADGSVKQY